jgi:hypothetical protein
VRAAAVSEIGTGPYSELINDIASGVRMSDTPKIMVNPKVKDTTSTTVTFTWKANNLDNV